MVDRCLGRVDVLRLIGVPVKDAPGKGEHLAGRILDGDADQPKYINSPETTVYHKKEVLHGL
ncbi:MAG: hypothetical protein R6T83_00300, partial [Salinibacter sp.]